MHVQSARKAEKFLIVLRMRSVGVRNKNVLGVLVLHVLRGTASVSDVS